MTDPRRWRQPRAVACLRRRSPLLAVPLICGALGGCRYDGSAGDFPPDAAPGPACGCGGLFPMCVGAHWTYDVYHPVTNTFQNVKIMEIVGFEPDASDPMLEGRTDLFVHRRTVSTEIDTKWARLVREGERILWLKDEWYDAADQLTSIRHYVPGKTRIDEAYLFDGDTWAEVFTEYRTEYGPVPGELTLTHDVSWDTRIQDTPDGRFTGVTCQHKVDVPREDPDAPVVATYCFSAGLGKVYELTENDSEEFLTAATIPGCDGL